ncbi:MAG: polysaccharide deacetylase family protein [Gemmatimonadales bacterium]
MSVGLPPLLVRAACCTLAAVVLASCSDGSTPPVVIPPPELEIAPVGATTLAAVVDSEVVVSVRVRDPASSPFAGAAVTWSPGAGSGSISSSSPSTSDEAGYASAVWRLGTVAGMQRMTATVTSAGVTDSVEFSAVAVAGPAASASLTADSILLSARGETAFLGPTHRDAFLNPAAPGTVTWTSRAPSVATVAPDGLVTGQAAGATYVVLRLGTSMDSILVTVAMRGAITFTFDDGFLDAYTNGWPVFQELGLPGNVAVNPAQVGFGAYMTKAHLDELDAAGWSMVSHTMTHDSMPSLTAGELDWELRASQEWIDAQGYRGSNVFVVPYHVWGARERDAVGAYYEAARGTSAGAVSPDSLVAWKPSLPYALTGIDAGTLPFTTAQGRDRLRALLQRTVDEGRFLDVYLHHLSPADAQAFREMVAVIAEFRQRVLPYHELYPRFARSVH